MRATILLITFNVLSALCFSQARWDGEANDGEWMNPVNWVDNIVPGAADHVILDNLLMPGSYQVNIGSGDTRVNVRSISIKPSAGNFIDCIVPASNIAVPAIRCVGEIYGLTLFAGATFINASGAEAGMTIEIEDSVRINNGGKYVHRTPRSHADLVRSLSRDQGTELGEFEFNIPVASSTISLSGQVFGKLKLTPGPGGIINYTGTGTNGLTVRSDLEIAAGVNLTFNLETNFTIGGNLIQQGGTINLGTTARKLEMSVKGNLIQSAGATITETGTAVPEIILNGNAEQQLTILGTITNEVVLKVKNSLGIIVTHSFDLPYRLDLEDGIITTQENIIGLLPGCTITYPLNDTKSFINGRLRKDGLVDADFVFPVGRDTDMRWVGLKKATGNFLAEYVRSDPRQLEFMLPAGIEHISALEYWQLTATSADAMANVELSFHDVNSGGVTDLAELRVAMLQPGSWINAGNTGTTGSAGSLGSVTGTVVTNWLTTQPMVFTLASTVANQNPLPVTWRSFHASRNNQGVLLNWSAEEESTDFYEIMRSVDGVNFKLLTTVDAGADGGNYSWLDDSGIADHGANNLTGKESENLFYQVTMVLSSGLRIRANIERVSGAGVHDVTGGGTIEKKVWVHIGGAIMNLKTNTILPAGSLLQLFDVSGRQLCNSVTRSSGSQFIITGLPVRSNNQVLILRIAAEGKIWYVTKVFAH